MAENQCQECGATVEIGAFHDYIECVRYRWQQAECEPGRLSPAKLQQDMRAVLYHFDHSRFGRSVNGGTTA